MTEEKKNKNGRSGCLWALIVMQSVIILAVLLFVGGIFAVGVAMNGSWNSEKEMGTDDFPPMAEQWASGQGTVKVVRIPLRGMIMLGEETGLFGSDIGSADHALASIRRATNDPEVQAIILDIDSGGGGITACDIIHDALLDFKKSDPDRRIISLLGDVAASGAYYIAAATDRIIARPTTVTGSIGVIMQSLNFQDLAVKLGIRDVTIKSGANKDLLNPLKELSPEQLSMLQGIVDSMHDRFVTIVSEGRNLPEADVREFADGRVMTADAALALSLLDTIGHWDAAVDATCELLDVEDIQVFRYETEFGLSSLLKIKHNANVMGSMVRRLSGTRFLYLWQP